MKLFLSDTEKSNLAWGKQEGFRLRMLLSYWYYKDIDLDVMLTEWFGEPRPEIFADSGAFSAATQKANISVSEYGAWLQRYKHLFSAYASLDVIGNATASAENQEQLEQMGLTPLPVFHAGSPWAELESLLARYSYIGLGGMVPYARERGRLMPWLVRCFQMAKGRAVFHGFGATSWLVIKSLPWYSVDSSSWGTGFRYGLVPLFDSKKGCFYEAVLGDVKTCYKYRHLIRRLGFNWLDFADRKRYSRRTTCAISALSYLLAEQWLTEWHGKIDLPSGVRICLADANPKRLAEAQQGLKIWLSDTGVPPRDLMSVKETLCKR